MSECRSAKLPWTVVDGLSKWPEFCNGTANREWENQPSTSAGTKACPNCTTNKRCAETAEEWAEVS